ncbi:MAG: archaetidylserine decarboxylase [Rhodovibrio sp.]|nr:archaetidylserine decarboxylase [Rhodovibrio sp.]
MIESAPIHRHSGRIFLIIVIALAAIATGIVGSSVLFDRTQELRAARAFPEPMPLPEFELRTAEGEALTRADFEGQWSLLFFGFTNCPDICPDTLAVLDAVMGDLETMGADSKPQVVFVSVDPERDDGEALADYVEWFNEDFVGATGPDETLRELTRSVGVTYQLGEPDADSGYYSVDHSASIMIVDPQGRIFGRFAPPLDRQGHCRRRVRVDAVSAPIAARLRAWPQYLLPQKGLTALAWRLSRCRWRAFNQPFIRLFVRLFGVDLAEAERGHPADYECFNDFFTRSLAPGARPLADDSHRLVCPSDGTVSQLGRIDGERIFQAKGFDYSAAELLAGAERARAFRNGRFVTVYLAPRDYHRVHSPVAGRVVEEVRVPGRLFSVSANTTRAVPRLFARNERMVALLETEHGPVAVVMVAAMLVAGIETVWGGPDDRRPGPDVRTRAVDGFELDRGDELGRFHWGSTVIVLTPKDFPDWHPDLAPQARVRMGQALT